MSKDVKFNFDKKDVNSTESQELNKAIETETQAEPAELIDNALDVQENTSEIESEEPTDETEASDNKVVVMYIGNGVWRDGKGECWSRTDNKHANILSTRTYTQAEYEEREDIKFMVKYGEMKLSVV